MSGPPPRVLLAEIGEGGPDAALLGRLLRDEGMEVVHAGALGTAEQLVRTADQEDPDVLGVVVAPGAGAALAGLDALSPEVHLFVLGAAPDGVERRPVRAFETAEEVVGWLSGVRSHTGEAPPDRVR
ncbi:hypothetical protein [Amycolatopsis samaneae]|uniref:Methylmalonyl-CoA mutase, C-terminal domain n=1 Tax=Amycolatopsis samaneae TaxID=664691 RepID=A0ABW5GE95_9PSEU